MPVSFVAALQDGTCRFEAQLGKGRHGEVYSLSSAFLPCKVAVKTGSQQQLQEEAAVMGELRHPNIVAGYGLLWGPQAADGSGPLWLAMERMQGSLAERLLQGRSVPLMLSASTLHLQHYDQVCLTQT